MVTEVDVQDWAVRDQVILAVVDHCAMQHRVRSGCELAERTFNQGNQVTVLRGAMQHRVESRNAATLGAA
jgi:hypothetical protein